MSGVIFSPYLEELQWPWDRDSKGRRRWSRDMSTPSICLLTDQKCGTDRTNKERKKTKEKKEPSTLVYILHRGQVDFRSEVANCLFSGSWWGVVRRRVTAAHFFLPRDRPTALHWNFLRSEPLIQLELRGNWWKGGEGHSGQARKRKEWDGEERVEQNSFQSESLEQVKKFPDWFPFPCFG